MAIFHTNFLSNVSQPVEWWPVYYHVPLPPMVQWKMDPSQTIASCTKSGHLPLPLAGRVDMATFMTQFPQIKSKSPLETN